MGICFDFGFALSGFGIVGGRWSVRSAIPVSSSGSCVVGVLFSIVKVPKGVFRSVAVLDYSVACLKKTLNGRQF